jgi:hypothetical protein
MDRFAVGAPVTVEITYVDYNGVAVTPTAVSYTLLDETDTVLDGPNVIAGPYTTKATITIAGGFNSPAGARQVELKMTTAAGAEIYADATYEVRAEKRLVALTNSFQTYLQAQMLANSMPRLTGWAAATEDQRIYAMEEAFIRLTRFGYLIRWPAIDTQNVLTMDVPARITPQMWPLMTADLFDVYPTAFKDALNKAQVTEANAILVGDPVGAKIRAGILAETVGESKMMFRSGIKPLNYGVHRDTFEMLKGYISTRMTLTRTV